MEKILIVGASGLIGYNVYRDFLTKNKYMVNGASYNTKHDSMEKIDITKEKKLNKYIEAISPSIIINCSGIVGKSNCNKNPKLAKSVNEDGAINIAKLCKTNTIRLVHLSTVSVHDGKKNGPYNEEDRPSEIPGNWYNITKGRADNYITNEIPSATIIRIGDTYGYGITPRNIGGSIFKWAYKKLRYGSNITTYYKLKSNWTLISDLSGAILKIVELKYSGIINLGANAIETGDFFSIMKGTFNLVGRIKITNTPKDYQSNKELDVSKMRKIGIKMLSAEDGLNSLIPYYKI